MFVKTILLILLLPRFTHCRLRTRWNQSFLINISLKWLQKRHTPKTLLHDLQGKAESARIPFVYHCFSAENQNAEFLSIELNGSEVESQLRKIVSSGARMDGLLNISFDEYSTVTVLLPDIKEQEHIADFFRNLDHLITLHQRKSYIYGMSNFI